MKRSTTILISIVLWIIGAVYFLFFAEIKSEMVRLIVPVFLVVSFSSGLILYMRSDFTERNSGDNKHKS